jgi:transcription elongation factor GreA
MPRDEYLTQEKYDELKQRLDHLKNVERKENAEALGDAKMLGDLSENFEYQNAREKQAETESEIIKIESQLKNAVIVSMHHSDVVGIGSTVTVKRDEEKDKRVYHIVGSEEVDMEAGKISNHSPLGQALMGKKKGDTFTFSTPKGPVGYTIIDIA